MFETIKNAFKVKEIRVKMLWTLLFLLLYRVGSYIPVPKDYQNKAKKEEEKFPLIQDF